MQKKNILIIMADEHSRKICGTYGNRNVRTPNIDRLAKRGTKFTNAYTPCPICVPARAAFATGQPVHTTGHWDNAFGYTGEPKSWAHLLADTGYDVVSIGKLHYRSADDDTGFTKSIDPMYLHKGEGDVLGSVREPLPVRRVSRRLAERIGPGESEYTIYDRRVTQSAVEWLADTSTQNTHKPWAAFVSFVAPHFPLIAPQEFYDIYDGLNLMPEKGVPATEHAWLQAFRDCYAYDNFDAERTRVALASYYGLTSFMDENVGQVLASLESSGMANNTIVLYVSDHGENAGERGLWGKSLMFEESVGIPMILAGPGVPQGKVSNTPVTLLDVHPTVISLAGLATNGQSLVDLARNEDCMNRVAFSEYHAAGATSAAFMIRKGKYKYIHYVNYPPQLFDLETDPEELNDIACIPEHLHTLKELESELRNICNPEAVDIDAKRAQRQKVEEHGGWNEVVQKGGFGATPPPLAST